MFTEKYICMRELIGCILGVSAFVVVVILYFLGVGIIEIVFNEIMALLVRIPFWVLIVSGIVFMGILFRQGK